MCKGQTKQAARPSTPRLFLASLDSFCHDGKDGPPRAIEMITTCLIIISTLVAIEYNLGQFLEFFQVSPCSLLAQVA
jgi:hypothetical protein